jgi:hypothetical protein
LRTENVTGGNSWIAEGQGSSVRKASASKNHVDLKTRSGGGR